MRVTDSYMGQGSEVRSREQTAGKWRNPEYHSPQGEPLLSLRSPSTCRLPLGLDPTSLNGAFCPGPGSTWFLKVSPGL